MLKRGAGNSTLAYALTASSSLLEPPLLPVQVHIRGGRRQEPGPETECRHSDVECRCPNWQPRQTPAPMLINHKIHGLLDVLYVRALKFLLDQNTLPFNAIFQEKSQTFFLPFIDTPTRML